MRLHKPLLPPVALVLALSSSSALAGCATNAQAAPEKLWRDGTGKPVTKDAKYDPHRSLAPLIRELGPAVVIVLRDGGEVPGRTRIRGLPFSVPELERMHEIPRRRGIGSGFILSRDGLVVTNHHVAAGAGQLKVKLADGRTFAAKLLGSDPETDLAVLRLEGAKDLPTVALGSSDRVEVGDWVVAIGNPMGLEHSVTTGIVSAKGRGSLGLYPNGSYIDFLQTDADIAPGNSGGPLFDLNGEVIGINTAVGMQGPGFAVPIDQAKRVIPQLAAHGKVSRGYIGILGNEVEPAALGESARRGAVVGEVAPDSPAAKAGLRAGDRILEIDGKPVEGFDDFRGRIADTAPGTKVALGLERDGKAKKLDVTLVERPDPEALARAREHRHDGQGPARLGAQVEPTKDGLVIRGIEPGSLAEQLGLRAGDVLQEVNGRAVRDAADVRGAIQAGTGTVSVKVRRGDGSHSATIERL